MTELRVLPYYKWFWQDWRSDRKVQRMTYIHRGLYRELLDECWVEGSIPNDIASLSEICGCPKDVMEDAWQVLNKCFVLSEDEKELFNEKLHSLRTAKDVERLSKSKGGKKGGLSKSLKNKEEIPSAKHIVANAKDVLAQPNIEEKRREEKRREIHATPEGVSPALWKDFLKVRKAKRLAVTDAAIKKIQREAQKAGLTFEQVITLCCEKGWGGFEAKWDRGDSLFEITQPEFRFFQDEWQQFIPSTGKYRRIDESKVPQQFKEAA